MFENVSVINSSSLLPKHIVSFEFAAISSFAIMSVLINLQIGNQSNISVAQNNLIFYARVMCVSDIFDGYCRTERENIEGIFISTSDWNKF